MENTLGLNLFKVFEPESGWSHSIMAKSASQAIDKAWFQYWSKLPFLTCKKDSLKAIEI